MAVYEVAISGDYSLQQINAAIAGEEAGASEFRGARMETSDGRLVNVARFGELNPGTLPRPLKILREGETPPPNAQRVWSGMMAVGGTTIPVVAYRVSHA